MNIGIIIYSQTGNTYSVALKIQERLLEMNNKVSIEKIEVIGNERPRKNPFQLKLLPLINKYDVLIFGSLVEAFSLSPVMKSYLEQLSSLENKKVVCFVTQFFPYPWMGGNNAIKQMRKICEEKRGTVCKTAIINWKNKKREEMIRETVDKISEVI